MQKRSTTALSKIKDRVKQTIDDAIAKEQPWLTETEKMAYAGVLGKHKYEEELVLLNAQFPDNISELLQAYTAGNKMANTGAGVERLAANH